MMIPALHIPKPAEPIHFYHANGFPAEVYMPFLTELAHTFDVHALHGRATREDAGEPNHKNWHIYADDLIEYLEHTQNQPIIAIGHSMGASSTVLAAVKRPDLFKALVLIEPAMLNFSKRLLLNLLPKQMIENMRLVKGTAQKPNTWDDPTSYKQYIKKFKGYAKFSEEAFDTFAQYAIKNTANNKVTLRFPNNWEAYNYTNPPYLMGQFKKLERIGMPTVAIRGMSNGFFNDNLWQTWQSNQPSAHFIEDKAFGHLMPLESPKSTVALINRGLQTLKVI